MLRELPTSLAGRDVQVVVADDGSSDDSAPLAEQHGAQVLRFAHRGLAATFRDGLRHCLPISECVVVMDADGQYDPAGLEEAVRAVLTGEADVTLIERLGHLTHRPLFERLLHRLGALMVSALSGTWVRDPVSGYRVYGPRAQALTVYGTYTYTVETLMQLRARQLRLTRLSAPARRTERPSRLITTLPRYVRRQGGTLIRCLWTYRRLEVLVSALTLIAALTHLGVRGGVYENIDAALYAAGVTHFSVAADTPQWPGYPVLIMLARAVRMLRPPLDALGSLQLISALSTALATAPLMAIAARFSKRPLRAAVIAGALWTLCPLGWNEGVETGSDPLGMLLGLTALFLLLRGSFRASGAVFALLLGARLPYLPMLLALLPGFRSHARRTLSGLLPVVAAWAGWQLWQESLSGLWTGARTQLHGHTAVWGGSVLQPAAREGRAGRLARTLVINGLGGWAPPPEASARPAATDTLLRLGVDGLWSALTVLGARSWWARSVDLDQWRLTLFFVPLTLSVMLGNDVGLVRYDFPLLAALCLLCGWGAAPLHPRGWRWSLAGLAALTLVAFPLASVRRSEPNVDVQAALMVRSLAWPKRAALQLGGTLDENRLAAQAQAVVGRSVQVVRSGAELARWRMAYPDGLAFTAVSGQADWPVVAVLSRPWALGSRQRHQALLRQAPALGALR